MADLRESVAVSELEGLRATRDLLASTMDRHDTSPSERAQLAGRLMACMERITRIEKATRKGSMVDEIADRRAARRAGTPGAKSPRRSSVIGGAGGG